MRDDDLLAFVGDARARMSADDRRRRRWLSRQLDDRRTFAAVCERARDAGVGVSVDLVGGRSHRGRLVGTGPEVLVVATLDGATAYIALTAVVALRQGGVAIDGGATDRDRTGGRHAVEHAPTSPVDTPATVTDVMWDLAERCATADIGVIGGTRYRGSVATSGTDVVTLADGRSVRLQMVTDVVAVP